MKKLHLLVLLTVLFGILAGATMVSAGDFPGCPTFGDFPCRPCPKGGDFLPCRPPCGDRPEFFRECPPPPCHKHHHDDGDFGKCPPVVVPPAVQETAPAQPRRLIDILGAVRPNHEYGLISSMRLFVIDATGEYTDSVADYNALLALPRTELPPEFMTADGIDAGNFAYIISFEKLNEGPNYFVATQNDDNVLSDIVRIDRTGEHLEIIWNVPLSAQQQDG